MRCPCCGQEAEAILHGLRFDEKINVVWIDGRGLRLWHPTFRLMTALQYGRPISSQGLAERLCMSVNNLRVYVRHLRIKLEDTPYYIVSHYGTYQLKRMKQWTGPE